MIVFSAVWHQGHLFTGKRHYHCIASAVKATGIRPVTGDQGFLTHDRRFLDRKQAARHALHCGQIKKLKFSRSELFSEDLW